MPSLGYLQIAHPQSIFKSLVWTPWKKILSQEASLDLAQRRSSTRKQDFAWKIQQLVTVRAHAFTLCGEEGHLHSWMNYSPLLHPF